MTAREGTGSRVLRWLGRLVVGAVALVLFAYLAMGAWKSVQNSRDADAAREWVARMAEDPAAAVERRDAVRPGLGEPVASWTQVVCELTSQDAGWMVQNWVQRCETTAVDAYRAAPGLAERASATAERLDPTRESAVVLEVQECSGDACADLGPAPRTPSSRWAFGATASTEPRPAGAALPDGDLVVVTATADREVMPLGCHPWKPIFCDEPRDSPALP
ncbi:hypothetical protein BCF74_1158 [Knoellia remsis]|uniref:Uncharacterized protein n=1 Tax=Knoellia remsis TaxID=407159 RepID=A0A2T0UI32_9MICO|nr:hypothetical protein [Knoellia remsis]PRY57497.1 hypothetical protein BCF74_1158 [Knoellia remsis]